MDYASSSTALVFDLKKESPFSFKCQVCSACCFNKAIRVAPYEALRLARNLDLSTTEFYEACTEEGGIVLRNRPDGSCIFLDAGGCGVYADRPLVCRLFPLGQITDREGRERYASMPLHPDCLGHFGSDGTVGSYLDSQGSGPYFYYAAVYEKVLKKLQGKGFKALDILSAGKAKPPDPRFSSHRAIASTWFDIDKAVAAFCQKNRRVWPKSIEEAVQIHLEAIEGWLAGIRKRRRLGPRKKHTFPR